MTDWIALVLFLALGILAWGFVHLCAALEDPAAPGPAEESKP